jgi:hypothetical protein
MELIPTWKTTRRTQQSFSYAQTGTVCFRFQLLGALLNRPTHIMLLEPPLARIIKRRQREPIGNPK